MISMKKKIGETSKEKMFTPYWDFSVPQTKEMLMSGPEL